MDRVQAGDKVRQRFHPEWGDGRVYYASQSRVLATWEHHVQQVPLPHACVEKI